MEVRIGVTQTPKEIELDLGDGEIDQVVDDIQKALADGGGPLLWLTDRRGRRVAVVAQKIAYVELGPPAAGHRVGFSAG
jgi:hypothetical protein